MRWVVFDDETAEVVVSEWRRGAAEISHEHALDAALEAGEKSVLVLPSHVPGQMLVARLQIRNAEAVQRRVKSVPPAATPEENGERKPWWRKFVA